MNTSCPHCGKPVPPDAPGGICPECMLNVGVSPATGELDPSGTIPLREPPPSPPLEDIAALFPQLEMQECLGRGGMGAVYKARQPKLDRMVAVKVLLTRVGDGEPDPGFADRFEREARALAQLNHPNIVSVYDFGETNGYLYLIMEYVEGLNLRQMIHARQLKSDEALAIVPHICEALQYAHEHGIIHRDIKPENILLNQAGQVKIADFGIAKMIRQQPDEDVLTREHHVMGTPHYMAPEQVETPLTVDHRADIYSLGVVFYEMLTGELPLGKFAPPSRKVNVDVRLDEVVLHALEKEPDLRYQRASEVKTDIEDISLGSPPGAASSRLPPASPHLSMRQRGLLQYGLLGCLIGLPFGLMLGIPFVTVLSAIGLMVVGLKWTGRWPIPSPFSDEQAAPPPPPANGTLTENQMIVLYVGFACCVMGLGYASMSRGEPLFRLFLGVTGLIGLGALLPAILLRRRVLMPASPRPAAPAAPPRTGHGPLYWILTIFLGGIVLLILVSVVMLLLSLAVPALQQQRQGPVEKQALEALYKANPGEVVLVRQGPGGTSPVPVTPVPSAIGLVRELTLGTEGDTLPRSLDLDTGRAYSHPELADPAVAEAADLRIDPSASPTSLLGSDLLVAPVDKSQWDADSSPLDPDQALPTPARLQADPDGDATFLFRTREGRDGILRITGSDPAADPPTVTLKYKLLDSAN